MFILFDVIIMFRILLLVLGLGFGDFDSIFNGVVLFGFVGVV